MLMKKVTNVASPPGDIALFICLILLLDQTWVHLPVQVKPVY